MSLSMKFESRNKIIDVYDDPDVYLIDIKGLSPEGKINTATNAGYDGSTFVSDEIPERTIDMVLGFRCDDAEEAKERLYSIFTPKSIGTLIYESDVKKRKIEYRAIKVEACLSEYPMKVQVSLTCTNPFFMDLNPTTAYMASSLPAWEFPFEIPANNSFEFETVNDGGLISSIENKSNIEVGCVWKIKALANISKPKIVHLKTYQWFEVDLQLQNGDILEINTKLGNEAITLTRGQNTMNVFNHLVYGSDFLQLFPGQNEVRYTNEGDSPEMTVICCFENAYGGI